MCGSRDRWERGSQGPRGQDPLGPAALQKQLRAEREQDSRSFISKWPESGWKLRTPVLVLAILPEPPPHGLAP